MNERHYTSSNIVVPSENDSSVGYGGLIFVAEPPLLKIPRTIMNWVFHDNEQIDIEQLVKQFSEEFKLRKTKKPYGIFVTIEKNKEVRGCIGQFKTTQETGELIAKYTLLSAFHDTRFDPIRKEELPDLSYKVNFLDEPIKIYSNEKNENPFDAVKNAITIGVHGITIYFEEGKRATYLASVLPELGIDKIDDDKWKELVKSLKGKAGAKSDIIARIEIYKCTEFGENDKLLLAQSGGVYVKKYKVQYMKFVPK